jgi:hypothetical protein
VLAAVINYLNNKINPLNAELNPICHLLALLKAHHILHVSRIRVKYSSKSLWSNISHFPQHCNNSKYVIFSGETFKGFEVL